MFGAKTGASLAGDAHSAGTVYLGQITFIRQDARDIKVGLDGISLVSGFTFLVYCFCSSAGERPDDRPGVSGDVAHHRHGAAGARPPGTGRTGQAGEQ